MTSQDTQDLGSTREKLIDTVVTMLNENEQGRMKVQDIAKRAGLTTGAIYWCFKDRRDLIDTARAERYIKETLASMQASREEFEENARQGIPNVRGRYVVEMLGNPRLRRERVQVLAAAMTDPALGAAVRVAQQKIMAALVETFTSAQAAGIFRPDIDPVSLGAFVYSFAVGYAAIDLLDEAKPDPNAWLYLIGCVVQAFEVHPSPDARSAGMDFVHPQSPQ